MMDEAGLKRVWYDHMDNAKWDFRKAVWNGMPVRLAISTEILPCLSATEVEDTFAPEIVEFIAIPCSDQVSVLTAKVPGVDFTVYLGFLRGQL